MKNIFNSSIESIDEPDRYQGMTRYRPKGQLLTSYMEYGESRVKYTGKRLPLHVRVEMICSTVG